MISFTKTPLGLDDISIGTGHTTQTRNNEEVVLHNVPIVYNAGLLSECNIKDLPTNIEVIEFTGYYTECDGGEGIYLQLPEFDKNEDIGVIINSNYKSYKRQGITDQCNIKWFGAKGDGKTNDALAFKRAISRFNFIELQPNETYYIELDRTLEIPVVKNFQIFGNFSTIRFFSLQDEVALRFNIMKQINYFYISECNIEVVNVKYPFAIENQQNIGLLDILDNTTYSDPSLYENINTTNHYVDRNSEQTIFGNWTLPFYPTTNRQPTLDNHPVTKGYVDSQMIPQGDYVHLTDDEIITGDKVFTNFVRVNDAEAEDEPMTEKQLKEFIDTIDMQAIIKEELAKLNVSLESGDIAKMPVGYEYLQFPVNNAYVAAEEPAQMQQGTVWTLLNEVKQGNVSYYKVWQRTE